MPRGNGKQPKGAPMMIGLKFLESDPGLAIIRRYAKRRKVPMATAVKMIVAEWQSYHRENERRARDAARSSAIPPL